MQWEIQGVPAESWPDRLVSDLKSFRSNVKDGNEYWCEQVEVSIRQIAEEVLKLRQEAEGK